MRRLFLVLVILWLPIQSAFPAELLSCVHEKNIVNTFNYSAISITVDDHFHAIHIEPSVDSNMSTNQDCDANILCHVTCNNYITAEISQAPLTKCILFNYIILLNPISFIPEQFQRPPLA